MIVLIRGPEPTPCTQHEARKSHAPATSHDCGTNRIRAHVEGAESKTLSNDMWAVYQDFVNNKESGL